MKKIILLTLVSLIFNSCGTLRYSKEKDAKKTNIVSKLDLNNIVEDRIPVEINPGKFNKDTVIYKMPRVVQGTYSISNFGRFVKNFKPISYSGKVLDFSSEDINTWKIFNANNLDKIIYEVEDTFDIENSEDDIPFSPAGTNIEDDNFMLNLFAFIGYFESLQNNSYELIVSSNEDYKKSSALKLVSQESNAKGFIDSKYFANRYFDIADNPMMYGDLDVEEFMVEDIKIVLSVYSPNKNHTAKSLVKTVEKMMFAQKKYLGSIDSTSRYDIFLYLSDDKEDSPTGLGALEHHNSTVVVLSDSFSEEMLAKSMIDIVAHEFFHILTPLSVHSEDIHYFDYDKPTFSKHLWMYEGVVEYFAQHFQVNKNLINKEEFYEVIMDKIRLSNRYDDFMSFTNMSENVLDEPYASNYYNVYQKGALIGMCLDIIIRSESNGEKGILWVMKQLSNKYGKQKPFKDDLLFDEIISLTYPSVKLFFENHVQGNIPINYNDFFEKVGLKVVEGNVKTNFMRSGGGLIFKAGEDNDKIYFGSNVANNSFWSDQGVVNDDLLISIDNVQVTMENVNTILRNIYEWEPGRDIYVVYERDGEKREIKTKLVQSYMKDKVIIEPSDLSDQKKIILNSWLFN